jgi:predicted nucleic acid-binding protein
MSSNIAIDTNLLIYLVSSDFPEKCEIVDKILEGNPVIPGQVVAEFLNVTKRLLKITKAETFRLVNQLIINNEIVPTTKQILFKAEELMNKYDFQLFDSIVVASALVANCAILYSEDMHHNLLVEGQLKIINPFV